MSIPDATYKALRDARRAGCYCAPLQRPCPSCLVYLDGVEDGYRAGGVDAASHPAAQTLRYLAPFIRAAIDAGVWDGGTDGVEHELAAALAWTDRQAS